VVHIAEPGKPNSDAARGGMTVKNGEKKAFSVALAHKLLYTPPRSSTRWCYYIQFFSS
jgi:hypothetical protein